MSSELGEALDDLCALCNVTTATLFCVACQENLCDSCGNNGFSSPRHKHQVVPIADKPPTCPDHAKLLQSYCQACRALVCNDCVSDAKHAAHTIVPMARAADAARAELETLRLKSLHASSHALPSLRLAESRLHTLTDRAQEAQGAVRGFMTTLKQQALLTVNTKLHASLSALFDQFAPQEDALTDFCSRAEMLLAVLEASRKESQALMAASDCKVMLNREEFANKLAKTIEELVSLRPPEQPRLPTVTIHADAQAEVVDAIQSCVTVVDPDKPLEPPVLHKIAQRNGTLYPSWSKPPAFGVGSLWFELQHAIDSDLKVGEERKWQTVYEGYMLAVPLPALPPGMHLFRLRACPANGRIYSRFSPVRAALIIGPISTARAELLDRPAFFEPLSLKDLNRSLVGQPITVVRKFLLKLGSGANYSLQIDRLAAEVHKELGQSWTALFAPKHGPLVDFLRNHNSAFVVSANGREVSLRFKGEASNDDKENKDSKDSKEAKTEPERASLKPLADHKEELLAGDSPVVQLFARHIDSLRAIIRNELNIRVKRQCNMKNPRSEHGPSDAFFAAFLLRLLFNIHKIRPALASLVSSCSSKVAATKLDLHVYAESRDTSEPFATCSCAGDVFPLPADDSTEAELAKTVPDVYASVGLYLPVDAKAGVDELVNAVEFCARVERARLLTGIATLLIPNTADCNALLLRLSSDEVVSAARALPAEQVASLQICVDAQYVGGPLPNRKRVALTPTTPTADLKKLFSRE